MRSCLRQVMVSWQELNVRNPEARRLRALALAEPSHLPVDALRCFLIQRHRARSDQLGRIYGWQPIGGCCAYDRATQKSCSHVRGYDKRSVWLPREPIEILRDLSGIVDPGIALTLRFIEPAAASI